MASDWQPRLLAHREELARLVSLYGPILRGPEYYEWWDGECTYYSHRRRYGHYRCMWCGEWSGNRWSDTCKPTCPVRLAARRERLPADIAVARTALDAACAEVDRHAQRLADLIAEARQLGVEVPADAPRSPAVGDVMLWDDDDERAVVIVANIHDADAVLYDPATGERWAVPAIECAAMLSLVSGGTMQVEVSDA